MDNGAQLGVQRSRGNQIYDNLFVGGETAIEFNPDCREEDQINGLGKNTWCPDNGAGSTFVPEEKYIKIYKELI